MVKKVKKRSVGRPAGSLKEGRNDDQTVFRHKAYDKAQWQAAADKKETEFADWLRGTLNTAATRINR